MTRNLNPPKSELSKLNKNNEGQSLTQKSACYRGFTSIDQEMEREIAMQWFKPTGKSRFFQRVVLFRGRPQ